MGWGTKLKHATHKVAGEINRATTKLTGSETLGNLAGKAALAPFPAVPGLTGPGAFSAAHALGHLASSLEAKPAEQADAGYGYDGGGFEMPDYSEYLNQMGEYLAGMQNYIRDATALMTREEPAQEPLKRAQVEMSDARADTQRRQLLRRGLMSTYTRYGQSGGTQRLGA